MLVSLKLTVLIDIRIVDILCFDTDNFGALSKSLRVHDLPHFNSIEFSNVYPMEIWNGYKMLYAGTAGL